MDESFTIVLRLAHILGGIFWTGSVVFVAGFVEPVVGSMGPEGGRFMQGLVVQRRMPAYLTGAMAVTIVSGLIMYGRVSGGFQGVWMGSGTGIAISLGGLSAIGAGAVGLFVSAPMANRLVALGKSLQVAGGPPSAAQGAELAAMRGKLRRALRAVAVMATLAAALMAIARYL